MTPNITRASWLMILVLGLTWGATFMVIEIALRGITPFWLAAARIGFAAALMTAVWLARGGRLFLEAARDWPAMVMIGLLSSAVPFMLLSWGQQYTTSGFAGVSMAAVALMVLPLAHVMVPGERMTLRRTAGFAIGFAGVVVLIGTQAFSSTGAALEPFGRLACLGAAGCYALSSVWMRRLPAIDPIGLATVLLIIGAAMVLPAAWIVEGPPPAVDGQTLAVLALLGLVPTAAANILRVVVIRTAGPTFMSLTNYIVPVCSVVLGALVLSEPLPPSLLWALALILAGVFLSQWGALQRLFRG
ncbi:DMT family transporter [Nioella sediminis]|uniref:DMT family transporter n=1 Tax=Nioella sediminis TaxID=1912092 RepID=UPI0008FD68C8|nr:DMT family transporter [Nioella sediminis]TBX24470.1 membrane protein [Roseovarius sp. JS7-11]